MHCDYCGSAHILADAYAQWSVDDQEWELTDTYPKGDFCPVCDVEARILEVDITNLPPHTALSFSDAKADAGLIFAKQEAAADARAVIAPAETRPTLNDALGVCMILIAKQPDTSHRLVSPDLQALRDISEAIARAMDECEAIAETLYASVDIDGELTDRESLAAYKLRAMAAQS
jgi:hypothetical protein